MGETRMPPPWVGDVHELADALQIAFCLGPDVIPKKDYLTPSLLVRHSLLWQRLKQMQPNMSFLEKDFAKALELVFQIHFRRWHHSEQWRSLDLYRTKGVEWIQTMAKILMEQSAFIREATPPGIGVLSSWVALLFYKDPPDAAALLSSLTASDAGAKDLSLI